MYITGQAPILEIWQTASSGSKVGRANPQIGMIVTENAKPRNPKVTLATNKFKNIPADEEKVVTSERETSINGIDVLIQNWNTAADKAMRAVFASADVIHLNDH